MARISCGHDHSVSLCRNGSVYSWGSGEGGLLGNGSLESSYLPVKVLDSIVQVTCGGLHTMAIRQNGELLAWGRSEGGQLGIEEVIHDKEGRYQPTPTRVDIAPVR
jgi:alpha-tubulin suppressor-like RCC1 family protein